LFSEGERGADILRVIEVRQRLLQARDGYLDAVWEVRQACADLAAATGDPFLAACAEPTLPMPRKDAGALK